MVKGAIFDLDGTILDSMFIWDTIPEDYLRSLGKEPKENLAEVFKAFTLEQAAEYYRKNYGIKLSIQEIVEDINNGQASLIVIKISPHLTLHMLTPNLFDATKNSTILATKKFPP